MWLRCRHCLPDVLMGGLEVSLVLSPLQAPVMLDMCNAFSCGGKGCEIASPCLNVATSMLELGSSAESRTVRGINNFCTFTTFLTLLLMGKICVTFVAVELSLIL